MGDKKDLIAKCEKDISAEERRCALAAKTMSDLMSCKTKGAEGTAKPASSADPGFMGSGMIKLRYEDESTDMKIGAAIATLYKKSNGSREFVVREVAARCAAQGQEDKGAMPIAGVRPDRPPTQTVSSGQPTGCRRARERISRLSPIAGAKRTAT